MTTHDTDRQELEARLRASLQDRATDVQVTPALYERVERQARRGQWLRRGVLVAGAAAAVVATVTVVPALLPDPVPFDVVESPEDSLPSDAPTAAEESEPAVPVEDDGSADPVANLRLVQAEELPDGTGLISVGDRVVSTDQRVVTLATSATGSFVVAGLEDGSIGGINVDDSGSAFDEVVPAAANGSAVVATPDGDGVAWIEGTDLHVFPLADDAAVRVLPLEGAVPSDLRIEQWVARADAQVILASAPDGGLWSIPMDDSTIYDTAPTTPAFVLSEDAVDGAILDSLARVELVPDQAGTGLVLRFDGDPATEVPTNLPAGVDAVLTTDGDRLVLHDRTNGIGELREVTGTEVRPATYTWDGRSITAVAPLPVRPEDLPTGDDAAALGLTTDAPVIGTDGVALVIRTADGTESRRDVYRPAIESEAVLGDLAVRPGSTPTDGLVALESFSEGETSIRFARLEGDTATPVGEIVVTAGEVSGLVWSEDGTVIAWTDPDGLWAVGVGEGGELTGPRQFLAEDVRAVVDWVDTDIGPDGTFGYVTLLNGTGVELLGTSRDAEGMLAIDGVAGGSDRLLLDTHASPGAAVGPTVVANVAGAAVDLRWSADGDQGGDLNDAAPEDLDVPVQVEVGGGQVIVWSVNGRRATMVTFDGDIVQLPQATDWDVLD